MIAAAKSAAAGSLRAVFKLTKSELIKAAEQAILSALVSLWFTGTAYEAWNSLSAASDAAAPLAAALFQ